MRKKTKTVLEGAERFNRIPPISNAVLTLLFIVLGLICLIPLVFIFMISITSENAIAINGYSFFPAEFSMDAYRFLWENRNMVLDATKVSLIVTLVGTALGLFLTTSMGYVLSRSEYRLNSFFTWVVFIPMIFNGGLISTYFINKTVFGLGNTYWALILPLLVSSFNVVICKTYFKTSLPESIVESAQIDGASQMRIFFQIALPVSLPLLATIAKQHRAQRRVYGAADGQQHGRLSQPKLGQRRRNALHFGKRAGICKRAEHGILCTNQPARQTKRHGVQV